MKKTLSFGPTLTFITTAFLTLFSSISFAFAAARNLQGYIGLVSNFINNTLLPLLFAIALLFFLVNIVRYFIIEGADTYTREQARKFAMYGIIAFVFLTSIWGITNLIINGLGLDQNYPICPDYDTECNDSRNYRYSESGYFTE